jgi:hypothetical protein
MSKWTTEYGEELSYKDMSTPHLRNIIRIKEKNGETDSYALQRATGEIKSREKKSLRLTERYNMVMNNLMSGNVTREYINENMHFIVKDPDLLLYLFRGTLVDIDILIKYQDYIKCWSSFFFISKDKITDEYLIELVQSVRMSKSMWMVVVSVLDLDEDMITLFSDFVPPISLLKKDLSFIFWKNNIFRLYVFPNQLKETHSIRSADEYKKWQSVWDYFIMKYKDYITASFIYDCRIYIPKRNWKTVQSVIPLSSDYLIKLKEYVDISWMINEKKLSDKMIYQLRDSIKWDKVKYESLSDEVIVKLKNYVDWPKVFSIWSDEMYKPRNDVDRKKFDETGDILKYKNFVDWESVLVKWKVFTRKELEYRNITGSNNKLRYVRDNVRNLF